MKKSLRAVLTVLCALVVAFTFMPTEAFAGADKTGYIMFADTAWNYQYWCKDVTNGVIAKNVKISTKSGKKYTVKLDFTKTKDKKATGMAFTAIGIVNGEKYFPGYSIKINYIKINGKKIKFSKGYTSTDNGKETRMNIYNEWVDMSSLDMTKNAVRSYDGSTKNIKACIVNKDAFKTVKTYEVNFTFYKKGAKVK